MGSYGLITKDEYGRVMFDSRDTRSVMWLGTIESDGKTSGSIVDENLRLGRYFICILHNMYITEEEYKNNVRKSFSYPTFSLDINTRRLSWSYDSSVASKNVYPLLIRYGVANK